MMNLHFKRHRRKGVVLTAAAVLASLAILGGCSMGTAADTRTTGTKPAQTVDVSNISDARNTPVVRAAKAVGPAVVGITNKAVARRQSASAPVLFFAATAISSRTIT